jgi:hypothetical protein
LKLADARIKQVRDPARRTQLAEMSQQAQIPLSRALDAGHRFVYDELREYVALAQKRVDALTQAIEGGVATR